MAKPKTPSYLKKANDDYRAKKDTIQLYAERGERDEFRSVNLDNPTILELVRAVCGYIKATGEDVQSLIDEFRQRAEG